MGKTFSEPRRDVKIHGEYDVIICGGGVSGMIAALAASRHGAKTLLLEKNGYCGGTITGGLVTGIGGWQYDLDGKPIIGGLPLKVLNAIADKGGADPAAVRRLSVPRENGPDYRDGGLGCYWVGVNPEYVKLVMDELLLAAKTEVLFHAVAVDAIISDGAIEGILLESKSGRAAALGRVVIDATGDGDVAARAGCPVQTGRASDGLCQPMTLMFTIANASLPAMTFRAGEVDPATTGGAARFRDVVSAARRNGDLRLNPNDIVCCADPVVAKRPDILRKVNFTRVQRRLATDAIDLTQAVIEGRRQVFEAVEFFRKYIPGLCDAELVATAPEIGVRESRRIVGDYVLTGEDVASGRDFDDTIARGIYLLDIHNPSGTGEASTLRLLDGPYGIPYRSLLAKGIEGLLVAGRAISGDSVALSSYRIQSHCMAVGEAAGIAAALAARSGVSPRKIDVRVLQKRLIECGANPGPAVREKI